VQRVRTASGRDVRAASGAGRRAASQRRRHRPGWGSGAVGGHQVAAQPRPGLGWHCTACCLNVGSQLQHRPETQSMATPSRHTLATVHSRASVLCCEPSMATSTLLHAMEINRFVRCEVWCVLWCVVIVVCAGRKNGGKWGDMTGSLAQTHMTMVAAVASSPSPCSPAPHRWGLE
jgi:hypothetical protein